MIEISRVSTLSIHTTAVTNSSRTQASLAKLQDQLSSGLKGRTFEDYNGQVEQFVGLDKEVKRLQMYIEHNSENSEPLENDGAFPTADV
jgi:flagellin-like hook-associated protein FlgL